MLENPQRLFNEFFQAEPLPVESPHSNTVSPIGVFSLVPSSDMHRLPIIVRIQRLADQIDKVVGSLEQCFIPNWLFTGLALEVKRLHGRTIMVNKKPGF
jgi:hypothetical protein